MGQKRSEKDRRLKRKGGRRETDLAAIAAKRLSIQHRLGIIAFSTYLLAMPFLRMKA